MTATPTIAVLGASGHTGRFVVDELGRRGLPVVAVGRDAGRLEQAVPGVPHRVALVDDPVALAEAFTGCDVVISCAGPFLDTADVAADAAIRAGAHYVDVTAEAASAAQTLARWDVPARDAGVSVVPAVSFFGGLADLLVTWATPGGQADEVDVAIALDSWHPTAGTRATGARNTAPRLMISGGELRPLPDPPRESTWHFEPPFGTLGVVELSLSELVLISRHVDVRELHTHINQAPLDDLHDASTPPPRGVDELGRSAQVFAVEARVRRGDTTRRVLASGQDIYAVTAPLVVEAAVRLARGDGSPGAHAPGELFDPVDFLTSLAPHLQVRELAAQDDGRLSTA